MKRREWLKWLSATGSASVFGTYAQSPDTKPLTWVVPYLPGGGVDVIARAMQVKFAEQVKRAIIIDNKPGASGSIGAAFVAKSMGDGNTLLMAATPEVAILQHVMPHMPYNPETDLEPVSRIVTLPFALVANPQRPYKTLGELIDHAKKKPGSVTYATSGHGSLQHLAGALLESAAGIDMLHVPYKGVAQAVTDVIGGQTDIAFATLPVTLPYLKEGKLVGLGISSRERTSAAKDLAPIAQYAGLGQFELVQWFGLFAPAKTPPDVLARLNATTNAVLSMPDMQAALLKQGAVPAPTSITEFRAFLVAERAKFGRLIKDRNIKLES